ncbi:MAG: hypothetical protein AUG51_09460 [Acidobacteria bacterium 13_1_20CM_3_53_8]|nr:MAG: hypothetical protein AUG51_09460 [Acidobacteria bacterium 13_1_20CM_3_53_8]
MPAKTTGQPRELEQFLTVEELAAWLRCKPRTIYNRVHQKRIPYLKNGKFLRFDPEEIRQWMKKGARA